MAAAGRRLDLLTVFSRAGSLALAVAAVAVMVAIPEEPRKHRKSDRAMELVWSLLAFVVIPCGALVLLLQVGSLFVAGVPPPTSLLAAMIALEWLLTCSTVGTACAALAVAHTAMKLHACRGPTAAVCVKHLAAAAMACVAGALAAVSALGMLWILGSRFRRAQA